MSGTEALRIGMEFLKENTSGKIYLTDPTYGTNEEKITKWKGNHLPIAKACGLEIISYNYIKPGLNKIDWDSANGAIANAEKSNLN